MAPFILLTSFTVTFIHTYCINFTFISWIDVAEDELFTCANENKILISFANLEGALSIKLKGYNPIFVLLLPEDKLLYKKNIYRSKEKHLNQNNQSIEKVKKKCLNYRFT